MFLDYEKSARALGESIVKKWIFGGVDLSNPSQKPGPLQDIPEELLKKIFQYTPKDFPFISAVCHQFKKVQEKENGIIKATLDVWPWIAPTFRDNPTPTFSDIKTAVHDHLLRELTQLGINPHEAGLLKEDPRTYKNANRLIEAKNFCLFFAQIAYEKYLGPAFLRGVEHTFDGKELINPEQIFDLEDSYRFEFETFDHKKVTFFNLHGHGLTRLPQEVGLFENVEMMELKLNYLTSLPHSLARLKKLKELKLAGNNFTTIPDSIYHLSSLEFLSIHCNPIASLSDSLADLVNLKSLSLPVYHATTLPTSLNKLEHLKELSLIFLVPFSLNLEDYECPKTLEKAAAVLLPNCKINSHSLPSNLDSQGFMIREIRRLFQ